MKKAFLIQCLSLLLAISASAQSKLDRETMGLSGPVKAIETGRIGLDGKAVPNRQIEFNRAGNKSEETNYQDGIVIATYRYTYDPAGNRTGYEEVHRTPAKTLSQPRRHQYLHDARGNVIEYTVYEADGTIGTRFVYLYDQAGRKLEEQVFYHTGAAGGRTVHKYEADKEIETIGYDPDGSVAWKQVFKYDSRGRQIELIQYRGHTLRYRILSEYDDKGRIIKQETLEFNATPGLHISHAPVPGKVTYEYDDQKRTKEVTRYDADGTLKERLVYAYDEKGSQIQLRAFDSGGASRHQEIGWYGKDQKFHMFKGQLFDKFEYDSHGNWVRKISSLLKSDSNQPEPYGTEYRTITYY
ncbi:MAG: hypothetical protein AABM67_05655 [Acidobacteriota bacterium]